MPNQSEVTNETERLRVHEARGKAIIYGDGEEPGIMSAKEKKKQYRDLGQVQPLRIDDENFLKLLNMGDLKYYDGTLYRKI